MGTALWFSVVWWADRMPAPAARDQAAGQAFV